VTLSTQQTSQNELFPNKSLQERQVNFSDLETGDDLVPTIIAKLRPLEQNFDIITLNLLLTITKKKKNKLKKKKIT
jgi:hypothetical protein